MRSLRIRDHYRDVPNVVSLGAVASLRSIAGKRNSQRGQTIETNKEDWVDGTVPGSSIYGAWYRQKSNADADAEDEILAETDVGFGVSFAWAGLLEGALPPGVSEWRSEERDARDRGGVPVRGYTWKRHWRPAEPGRNESL